MDTVQQGILKVCLEATQMFQEVAANGTPEEKAIATKYLNQLERDAPHLVYEKG